MIRTKMRGSTGYSLIEVMIVVVIIGVLAGLVLTLPAGLTANARDQERYDDIDGLARRLEVVYWRQALGGPEYPSTAEISAVLTNPANRFEASAYQAPGGLAISVETPISSAVIPPTATGSPDTKQYVYQPLKRDGGLCTSAADTCVSYNLYYRQEASPGEVKIRKSVHRQ